MLNNNLKFHLEVNGDRKIIFFGLGFCFALLFVVVVLFCLREIKTHDVAQAGFKFHPPTSTS